MARKQRIGFKRRRLALTNYKSRLALVKSGIERIAMRRSNTRVLAQIIRYEEKGDKVLFSVDSSQLKEYKWPARPNRSTAYLTGLLLAKKIKAAGKPASEYILDIGLSSPVKNSAPFAFAKGCIDGGLKLKSNIVIEEKVYTPTSYAATLKKESEDVYKKQFSAYIKEGVKPEAMDVLFKQVKEQIIK